MPLTEKNPRDKGRPKGKAAAAKKPLEIPEVKPELLDENARPVSSQSDRSSTPPPTAGSSDASSSPADSGLVVSSRAPSPGSDSNLSYATDTTIKKDDFNPNLDIAIDFDEDSKSLPPFTPEPPKEEAVEEQKRAMPSVVDQEAELKRLELEKKERELRFEKLQQLLKKSAVYSQFLFQEVEKQKEIFEQKAKNREAKIIGGKQKRKAVARRSGRSKKAKVVEEEDDVEALTEMVESNGILRLELFKGTLREYQVQGVQWLAQLYAASTSGILGDEMGLGKTVQVIAFVCHMAAYDIRNKPFLIVVPLSTLTNWVTEFQRFAPGVPFVVYHGPEPERRKLFSQMKRSVEVTGAGYSMKPVMLTTYETVVRDSKMISSIEWASSIIDEGHRMKNHESRLSRVMRTFKSANRILMTGTPLQNNLSELWALLNFLMPELFTSLDVFSAWFDPSALAGSDADKVFVKEEREKQLVTKFHGIISPFLLRRTKADCGLKLPPKREILVKCQMTKTQLDLHEAILNYTIGDLTKEMQQSETPVEYDDKGRPIRATCSGLLKKDYKMYYSDAESENGVTKYYSKIADIISYKPASSAVRPKNFEFDIKMTAPMMQLRKVSAHPYLLAYPLDHCGQYLADENIINNCGKMLVLDRLLNRLLPEGHKVLIFSHFVLMLNVLADYMHLKGINCCRLDGRSSLAQRADEIKRFNEDPTATVFLISTRAGGLGLNLMAADTVIIYDSDWNPQVDLQAQDRAHRIGQTKPVLVFRLVTSNTVEEVIMARAAAKRKIETVILGTGDYKDKESKSVMSKKDEEKDMMVEVQKKLKALNRAALVNTESNILSDDQLNAMLDRSALEGPVKTTDTEELKWKHEYVGPCQLLKSKKEQKKRDRASAVASGASDAFEVLVDCAPSEDIEI